MTKTNKSLKDAMGTSTIRYDVEIIGAGSDGILTLNPKDIDFGTITVGFSKTMSVTVINKSNCNLYIELKMAQKVEEDGTIAKETEAIPLMKKILQECFKFDQPKCLLNAKTKKKVNITFKPSHPGCSDSPHWQVRQLQCHEVCIPPCQSASAPGRML